MNKCENFHLLADLVLPNQPLKSSKGNESDKLNQRREQKKIMQSSIATFHPIYFADTWIIDLYKFPRGTKNNAPMSMTPSQTPRTGYTRLLSP